MFYKQKLSDRLAFYRYKNFFLFCAKNVSNLWLELQLILTTTFLNLLMRLLNWNLLMRLLNWNLLMRLLNCTLTFWWNYCMLAHKWAAIWQNQQNETYNKQCLLDTPTPPSTVMVNKENYYQKYKGHTNWLSLISSHFAKNIFLGMTLLQAHAQYKYLYCLCKVSESFSKSSGTSWFHCVCTI